MNARERFWRVMRFEEVDRLPLWADWLGPWQRWREEGLPIPPDLDPDADDDRLKAWCLGYFGFEGMYSIFWGQPRLPVEIGPWPHFEEETFEETDRYRVYRSSNGGDRTAIQRSQQLAALHPICRIPDQESPGLGKVSR